MDTPVGDDEDSHIGDFIEDRSIAQPDEAATAYSLKENITRALESLAPREAVKFLPAPGLPPMSSPKFWSQVWRRTHIQGCPPEMPCREQMTNRVEIQSLL